MARSAPTPCSEPGCPALAVERGRCAEHPAPVREAPARRGARAGRREGLNADELRLERFYSSRRWQRLRNAHYARNPLCKHCESLGRTTPGSVVDHIIERRDGGTSLDPTNLQTLCHRCHAKKTAEARKRRPPPIKEW
jgi:5-methylcytosine-specific restriction protein A